MSRLLCCLCARQPDMGAALSHPQEGEACDGADVPAAPPTMADVIRERKKKAGGAGLGTLRRRFAVARRRDNRPDRGCEHARFIRSVVSSWRLAEVFLLCEELEAGAALRDLVTQAELAREPAAALHADLLAVLTDRWWCDVELVGGGWSVPAHRAVLAARCTYFRDLLQRYPPSCCRVPLEGACASLSRDEVEACVFALYAGPSAGATHPRPLCGMCSKWERGAGAGGNTDGNLDIINIDNSGTCRSGGGGGVAGAGARCGCVARRLAGVLGFTVDALHADIRYLLDSSEMCDARLVFRLESGSGAAYGFRSALELPCHRVLLAARSRFFRNVMSRRSNGSGGAVCVDEKVLPRRFARALLHAAYTDQVDLSLIGRSSSSPSSTNSTGSGGSAWAGVTRSAGVTRPTTTAMLDDAFQLYEIARFVEMPIVVQGCEDAIVEALSAETLPHVLRWAAAPHASHWVHRQAMRYLRDEFPAIMSQAASVRLPRGAVASALASPFLQASEAQALRALLRWAERQGDLPNHAEREPACLPHGHPHAACGRGGGAGGRGGREGRGGRGARRREASEEALREALHDLLALVRLQHLPHDHDLLNQMVRRGMLPASGVTEESGAAAWLGRGATSPPRCFLPYLDEIKALLEHQAVPEAEVARARRARYMHRIPDTLYMVAAARPMSEWSPLPADAAACVSPRLLAALRARARELRASPPALRALDLHTTDVTTVYRQIALRAVREMSLPDACAELIVNHIQNDRESSSSSEEWAAGGALGAGPERGWAAHEQNDCCRTVSGSGPVRCASSGSLRSGPQLHLPMDNSRAGTCRRDPSARSGDVTQHSGAGGAGGAGAGVGGGGAGAGRLSAAVPDVAMAPNANTHLLTARDYFRHPPAGAEYSARGVLQLDLGDGATHTPRPGSRAQRAGSSHTRQHHAREREHAQAMSCLRVRPDEDELRAAIELSVIRAYSSFHPRAHSSSVLPHRELSQRELTQRELTQRELTQRELPQRESTQRELSNRELTQREISQQEVPQRELSRRELTQRDLTQRDLSQREFSQRETTQRELPVRELSQRELSQRELPQRELSQRELSQRCRTAAATLPHSYRTDLHTLATSGSCRVRTSLSPSPLSVGGTGGPSSSGPGSTASAPSAPTHRHKDLHTPPPHLAMSRVVCAGSSRSPSPSPCASSVPSPSPRASPAPPGPPPAPAPSPRRPHSHTHAHTRTHDYTLYRHQQQQQQQQQHDYRGEGSYSGSGSASGCGSAAPHDYA